MMKRFVMTAEEEKDLDKQMEQTKHFKDALEALEAAGTPTGELRSLLETAEKFEKQFKAMNESLKKIAE